MSSDKIWLIATYGSSHAALRAERVLLARGVAVELIPVPREINSNCGFCLRVPCVPEDRSSWNGAVLAVGDTTVEGVWRVWERNVPGTARKERNYERIADHDRCPGASLS